MKNWSFFLEGMRDACTDLLDIETGGTQRQRVNNMMLGSDHWPLDDAHTKGYRYALSAIDLYLDQVEPDV